MCMCMFLKEVLCKIHLISELIALATVHLSCLFWDAKVRIKLRDSQPGVLSYVNASSSSRGCCCTLMVTVTGRQQSR